MKRFILFVLISISAINCLSAQHTYVFLGSFNWDQSKAGIYVFELDTTSGKLTTVTTVNGIRNPSYLALSPDGKFLYACTDTKTPGAGSVSSFKFDSRFKTLTFLNSQRSGGENPVYLTVHRSGKWLVNANYTEGSVSVFPLLENGTIDSMVQNLHYSESSIDKGRQDRAHIHSSVFAPDFNYIFLQDLGADKIRYYPFDSTQREPLQSNEAAFVKSVPGSGPRHFEFHPNGKFAYCIEELSGTVTAYKYENRRLDSIQRINTHTKKVLGGYESSDVHISPDGRFLYASNRGKENNFAIFLIKNDGKLKTVGYRSTLGNHPRNFEIDPTGKFLIVANVISQTVVVFQRNLKTGKLTKVDQELNITNVTSVQIKQFK